MQASWSTCSASFPHSADRGQENTRITAGSKCETTRLIIQAEHNAALGDMCQQAVDSTVRKRINVSAHALRYSKYAYICVCMYVHTHCLFVHHYHATVTR